MCFYKSLSFVMCQFERYFDMDNRNYRWNFHRWKCYVPDTLVSAIYFDFPRVREPRIVEWELRSGEKEYPLVTLDLNLTFMQTPAIKLVKFIIKKGTNRNSVITCLSATIFF